MLSDARVWRAYLMYSLHAHFLACTMSVLWLFFMSLYARSSK